VRTANSGAAREQRARDEVNGRRRSGVDPDGDGAGMPRDDAMKDRHRLGVLLFLVAAFGSFLLSIGLWFTDNRDEGMFVGLWVPSILAAGAFWIAAVRTP
jgi:hypothetical protein